MAGCRRCCRQSDLAGRDPLYEAIQALKPFAEFAALIEREHPGWDHDGYGITGNLTMAPFRRARAIFDDHQ